MSGTKCHLCLGPLICKLICDGCVADGLGSLRPPWLRSYRLHGAEKIPALAGLQEVLRTKPVGVRASRPADQHQADRCAKIEIDVEEGCKTLRHLTLAWLAERCESRSAIGLERLTQGVLWTPPTPLRICGPSLTIGAGYSSGGFMFRTESITLAATLVAALSLTVPPQAAHAYTAEQQQYCTGDALRLCGSEVPDVDRITACMIRNKSQLSPECRRVFGPPPSASAPSSEPANTKPVSARKFRPHKPKGPQSADAN